MLYIFEALLAISLVGLVSCKKPKIDDEDGPVSVNNENAQGEIVVTDTYQPIDWNKSENHVDVADVETGRFVLELGKDEVKSITKGDILTLDVDSAIYLRKVMRVTKSNGRVELETRQASLDEVFAGSTFEFCIGTPPDSLLGGVSDSIVNATRAEDGISPKPVVIYPSEVRYQDENGNWVKEPVSATRIKEGWHNWNYNVKKTFEMDKTQSTDPVWGMELNLDVNIDYAVSLTGDLLEVREEDFEGDEEAAMAALERSKAKWKPTFYCDPSVSGSADFYMKFGGKVDKCHYRKLLWEKPIKTFVFLVGIVPVELEICIGLKAENDMQITAGINAHTGLGVKLSKPIVAGGYKSSTHGWKGFFDCGKPKLTIDFPAVTIGGELDNEFYLGPYLTMYLYHAAGPIISLNPTMHFNAAGGAGVSFGSKDIIGDMDWTGPNLTLGWNASLKYQTKWQFGVGASQVLGGGAFESKPAAFTSERTLMVAPNNIVCLNPGDAKIGQLCEMKFKVKSWASYVVGSTTWGTLIPTPVQFRDTEKFISNKSGSGVEEIKEDKNDEEFTDWCYKWTDWGTGEVTVYWRPLNENSMLSAVFFNSKGQQVDEVSVKPSMAPGDAKAVDLGLSVFWASKNVGAKDETDIGDYVGWGDATGKATRQWEKPEWGDYVEETYKGLDPYGGLYRDRGIQKGRYDWASIQWGGEWRMPLKAQWDELINKCSWEWDDERNAYKVSGNGNYIWLPAAGWECGKTGFGGVGTELHYWSASLNDKNPLEFSYTPDGAYGWYTCYPTAWYFYAKPKKGSSGGALSTGVTMRCYRQSIRAIIPKEQ